MAEFFRSLGILLLGFVALVFVAAINAAWPIQPYQPNVVLPCVLYLAVAPQVSLVRGAILAFLLGYLHDITLGYPMSLHTFLMEATYLVARGLRLRIFLRGALFQAPTSFVAAAVVITSAIALRRLFDDAMAIDVDLSSLRIRQVVGGATTTAILAPVMVFLTRAIDASADARDDASVRI